MPEAQRGELRVLVERWGQKGFVDAFPEADLFEIRCAEERAVLDAAARGEAITNVLLHEWDQAKFTEGAAIVHLGDVAGPVLLRSQRGRLPAELQSARAHP
ncbi:hypothetical protein [Sorangium sp. So ce590]|uniref:hypothetical protein n=1 Tax=unclassified Sorangium TaxID=2621164 RepID=UPI003F62CB9A